MIVFHLCDRKTEGKLVVFHSWEDWEETGNNFNNKWNDENVLKLNRADWVHKSVNILKTTELSN